MRDTRRTLLISGGLTVLGAILTTVGAILFESQGETALTVSLVFIGLSVGPLALVWFVSSVVSGIRKEALESGKGEIARWRLTAAEWSDFREQEARFARAGRPPSMLNLRSGQPKDGDVVFSRRGVIADGDYHDLTPGGFMDLMGVEFVSGKPACLEFAMRASKSRGASGTAFGFTCLWLRVPVAASETREAMRVLAHYRGTTRRGVALAMRKPSLTIGICLGVAAACALAASWGFANREASHLAEAPLVAAVTGVILGIGALILAGIVAYRVHVLKS
jgi:hypothetical protein